MTLYEALLLKFKPANMDVLPLYIVLLGTFPLFLWLLLRRPMLALATSVAVYVLTLQFDVNLPAYPEGIWTFNPFAWQLLFVLRGMVCGWRRPAASAAGHARTGGARLAIASWRSHFG